MQETGGDINHDHDFTSDGHKHIIRTAGAELIGIGDYNRETSLENVTGTTDLEDGRPPFYELAYIMEWEGW